MSDDDDPVEGVTRNIEAELDELKGTVNGIAERLDAHAVHPVITEPVEAVTEPVVKPVEETVKDVVPAPPRDETPKTENPKTDNDKPSHGASKAWFG